LRMTSVDKGKYQSFHRVTKERVGNLQSSQAAIRDPQLTRSSLLRMTSVDKGKYQSFHRVTKERVGNLQ
ncbi:hypothetical protein, partial [Vibrio neptunius]|uniref:hypothetical protein n=1 Tax=Vibrio neptunius TaxID=170651 RepID=UPI0030DD2399